MSDSAEIEALVDETDWNQTMLSYTDKQLQWEEDDNGGSYTSGACRFVLSKMKSDWVVWEDAYFLIPLNIVASGGTELADTSLIAFKQSVLSFINGIFFQQGNTTILNEKNISLANNLSLMLNYDSDFQNDFGPELHFAKDSSTQVTNSAANTGITNNVTVNSGFAERVQYFKQSSTFGSATFKTVIKVPLKLIHPLFKSMNFPVINMAFKLNLDFNAYNNQDFDPMVKDVADTATTGLTVTIGSATIPGSTQTLDKVRLYYHTVDFPPEINAKLASQMTRGFSKKIFYTTTETILPLSTEVAVSSGSISRTLNASSPAPLRVWIVAVPTGSLSGPGAADGVDTGLCAPEGVFLNANVIMNNSRYYQNGLNSPIEFWDILEQQFPGHGSSHRGGLINYKDFLSGQRYCCFDVTRKKGAKQGPYGDYDIKVEATRDSVNSSELDYYYMIDSLACVSFHMSSSKSKVLVGLNQ